MHIEDDIAREGENDTALRNRPNNEERLDRIIDTACVVIVVVLIAFGAACCYCCPGCDAAVFCHAQQEGGAK